MPLYVLTLTQCLRLSRVTTVSYVSVLVVRLGEEVELIRENLFENPNREMTDAKSKVHCTGGVEM